MLEMRPGCERCDKDLPAESSGAWICSFECTFCTDCRDQFKGICPNCSGEMVARPTRAATLLERYPGARERTFKPVGKPAGNSSENG